MNKVRLNLVASLLVLLVISIASSASGLSSTGGGNIATEGEKGNGLQGGNEVGGKMAYLHIGKEGHG